MTDERKNAAASVAPSIKAAGAMAAKDATNTADASREIEHLCKEALGECRTSLMMAYRFLNVALWRLPFEPAPALGVLATDGARLAFDPIPLLLCYRLTPNELERDYLHAILHCVFRHPFDEHHPDRASWHLACDIAAESLALEMARDRFGSDLDGERMQAVTLLKERFGALTAPRLYRVLGEALATPEAGETMGLSWEYLQRLHELFGRDDHSLWDEQPQEESENDGKDAGGGEDESDDGASPEERESGHGKRDSKGRAEKDSKNSAEDGDEGDAEKTSPAKGAEALREEWEKIGKQVEVDLETGSFSRGFEAGNLAASLKIANQKPCDYAQFLRRFAVLSEDMKVNDEEFDYVFYTYGLNRYGNMPLVEPLEYQEVSRVREFVIAIDTSGSCSGSLVKTFLSRTYDILKESEGFASKVNVHVVQCDARVQADVKITCMDDLETYVNNVWVKGFGGTDFRPVFEYVNRLIDQGEFSDLRGLVYFTDGLGTFPKKRPAYDTAFVFVDDAAAERKVPPWAMKVLLDDEGIACLSE